MSRSRKRIAGRLGTAALWAGAGFAFLLLFETPLRRIYAMARLWSEDLQPPLLVPVAGVRPSDLEDTWRAARSGGRTHEGIDIFADCGVRVLSSTEGIVLSRGEDPLGGQVIRVFGPGGTRHYYAHLGTYADADAGDHVLPGDVLGHVGNTGNAAATPCHLHYGIYRNGRAENPYPLLVPAAGSPTPVSP